MEKPTTTTAMDPAVSEDSDDEKGITPKESNAAIVVLITGGSGFIASHIILQLLAAGYTVRATLRTIAKEAVVRKGLSIALLSAGADAASHLARLSFYVTDLLKDDGWADAMRGCTKVLHVASPYPAKEPKSDDEVIAPAREGTLRVLRAAQAAAVQRVVLTSSFTAIGYGHPPDPKRLFTEKDWSVETPELTAYFRSKLLAERAAWAYVEGLPADQHKIELVTVCPVGTFGPVLPGGRPSSSVDLVRGLLDTSTSDSSSARLLLPQLNFNMVDVRDLADLQIRAMVAPSSLIVGLGEQQRFLGVADGRPMSLEGIITTIRKERPHLVKARGIMPLITAPNWMLRAAARFDSKSRSLMPLLGPGAIRAASNQKARDLLGWRPRPVNETILATVDSLAEAMDTHKPE
ncbi:MAG: hypothetical protein STHCBS139747_002169 [Sporothrix thermara]